MVGLKTLIREYIKSIVKEVIQEMKDSPETSLQVLKKIEPPTEEVKGIIELIRKFPDSELEMVLNYWDENIDMEDSRYLSFENVQKFIKEVMNFNFENNVSGLYIHVRFMYKGRQESKCFLFISSTQGKIYTPESVQSIFDNIIKRLKRYPELLI